MRVMRVKRSGGDGMAADGGVRERGEGENVVRGEDKEREERETFGLTAPSVAASAAVATESGDDAAGRGRRLKNEAERTRGGKRGETGRGKSVEQQRRNIQYDEIHCKWR
jgi:hypothetical protein